MAAEEFVPGKDYVQAPQNRLKPPDERRAAFVSLPAMHEMILTGQPYPIKSFFTTGSYLTQRANTKRLIHDVFPKLDLIVVFDVFMTPTAEYADIVLPGATAFESFELNIWPFPYLHLAQRVIEPLYQCKTDFWVFKELARRMGLGEYSDMDEKEYLRALLKTAGLDHITVEDLRKGPVRLWDETKPLVTYEDKRFPTPSGKMEFYAEKYAKIGEALPLYKEPLENPRGKEGEKYPLVFFTTHTRRRWHTCFQNATWLQEFWPGPELEINPVDAEARGIQQGDTVLVFNDRGRCKVRAKVISGIRPGLVNIEQGWWRERFLEGSHQNLTHDNINTAQEMTGMANMAFLDVLVEVKKSQEN
jgi:molybdopterin-containing oxidoreductase family molybdopterin binding subunit